METAFNLLLWIHFIALVVGGTNSVVMPVIGSKMAGAEPATRGTLFAIAEQLSTFGKGAMVVLLISGPLMMWIRYGGLGSVNVWFWVKMALIVVMLIGISVASINARKMRAGDLSGAATARRAGMVTGLAFLGVLLAAVLAFD